MTAASSLMGELREVLNEQSANIQRDFEATGDGRAAVAQRTRLVEDVLRRLWLDVISAEENGPANFALLATGGFGRGGLFPSSHLALPFLFADPSTHQT